MFRSILGFAILAVLAWLGLKLMFGILGSLVGLAMTVLWLAFTHPLAALVVVAILTAAMIWLIPRVWRMIRRIVDRVLTWFSHVPHSEG